MKKNVYTIYDRLAQEAGPLFYAQNDAVAIRQACTLLKGSAYYADYQLLHIAEFESSSGQLEIIAPARDVDFIITYLKLKEQENE